ncbi:MAG TPA: glycoside hydrolase family 3 N-terminal domain-containing protein [Cellulomonas sp.]
MTEHRPADLPFRDPTLPIDQRVEDLLSRMTLAEKAGQLFHQMTPAGEIDQASSAFGLPALRSMVVDRHLTHFNVLGAAPTGRELAEWQNAVQRVAAGTRLGIPVTFSTDPRHAFSDNPGTAMMAGPFSQWPETLGLAAIRDPEVTRRFADIARQEYLAVGLRVALHPQIDLATEPRWSRAGGTFGEDATLTAALAVAYVRGFQGDALGPGSVATMVKHFPGGGPQKDGEDPHFAYGREQVYPGGMFEHHLRPFAAAIAAGCAEIMPYYGMPVGTPYEEVGFGFNRSVITGLLRERFGFDGIVCTDWGLLTDGQVMGQPLPARAWGVEHLSRPDRARTALEAGVDQFGGELCPEVVVDLVRTGAVTEQRIDTSVRRLLRQKFALGLVDQPYVDPGAADAVVGRADLRAEGQAAQRASLTLLTNRETVPGGAPVLPLAAGVTLYVEGVDPAVAARYARVVTDPARADVAVVRLKAPYEPRPGAFEAFFHAGSLAFPAAERDRLVALCGTVPTVLDVYLDRPALLADLVDHAAAIVADYGAADEALLEVLLGRDEPRGALPFDLPRSMAAIEASREDVPFDTADPVFRFGHGLRYRRG